MIVPNDLYFKQVEQIITEGKEVCITVKGNSMRPLLRSNCDQVELGAVRVGALHVGDIVLFRYEGKHILHRIVAREGDRFTLAGDGNYLRRESCTAADIVAVAHRVIRPSGRVVTCSSRRWRWQSRLWLVLPPLVRRIVLGMMRRIGSGM